MDRRMSGLTIVTNSSEAEWTEALSCMEESNYGQTFEYGEAWSSLPHIKVLRLLAMDNGESVGLLQAVYRCRLGVGLLMRVGGIGGGAPLFRGTQGQKIRAVDGLLQALEEEARDRRIIRGRIYWEAKWGMNEVFVKRSYTMARELGVYVVPLLPPEDLWKKLRHNMRRKIRQAMKNGVDIVEAQDHRDLLSFYRMHCETCRRANIGHAPLGELEGFWKLMGPKGKSKVFLARWNGKDVAGAVVLVQGDTATVPVAGSLPEGWEARPNDYLHWKIMEWAHQQGLSRYNMGGINPDPNASSYGVYRWKIGYGGRIEKMLNYDKVYSPRLVGLYDRVLVPVYRAVRKLRRRR